jgi:hypothetical protein
MADVIRTAQYFKVQIGDKPGTLGEIKGVESKGSGVIVDHLVRARLLFFARPSLLVC